MFPKIENGAVFIADAHENKYRKDLWEFLQKIEKSEIKASQLFLMGDMFDLLVGKVSCTCKKYAKYIELIDAIAEKIPVFYFEGNHDFSLETLFRHVHVIPIKKQPMTFCLANDKKALLLHGDKYGSFVHGFYTLIIRSPLILYGLSLLDTLFSNFITKKIEENQYKKNLCQNIKNFEVLIKKKLDKYPKENVNYIFEGHYHQNKRFEVETLNYVNFSSFACNQSFFIVECTDNIKFAQMKLRG